MKTPTFARRVVSLTAALVVAALPLPARAQRPDTLLRGLYFRDAYHDGAALGDSLGRRYPRDTRLRAWYVANLTLGGQRARADSIVARLDTLSRDPWTLAAIGFARQLSGIESKRAVAQGLRAAQRARTLAPHEPDLAWLTARLLSISGGFSDSTTQLATLAFIDSVAPKVGNPVPMQLLRASTLMAMSSRMTSAASANQTDTARRNASLREYAAILVAHPNEFAPLYESAIRLRINAPDSAAAMLRRAIALSPRAAQPRSLYWLTINSLHSMSAADKQAAIAADRAAFLAATDSAPWALTTVIASMRGPTGRDPAAALLEDRVLAKAPRSPWAEEVLLARVNQWRDSLYAARDSARPGPKSDSTVVKQRFYRAAEAFLNKGWTADRGYRDQALLGLFFETRHDSTYPNAKFAPLVRQFVASGGGAPSFRYGEAARALGERKLEPKYAEQLAREGLKRVAAYLDDYPGYTFTSMGDKADALDAQQASVYDDLGWVYYNEGDYAAADKQLTKALDLTKKSADIYHDLGMLRLAQGRPDDAELVFAQGMTVRYRGVNPNRSELERLYEKKNGSIEGWEKYIAALEEKERAARRDKILATRSKESTIAPAFTLPDLAGQLVRSDSMHSQVLVVNFWGTWCGPCVAEMPELQQFYDKYRNDKSVTILTISNDKDLGELREWMAKRRLTIPTLFDNGFVANSAQIHAFPTTWFIDNHGKLQFSAVGNTGDLLNEWTWRLEATKNGPVVTP